MGERQDRPPHLRPGLAAPDAPERGKEVLVSSGIDVWCKRVSYPIVDRWYNKGHDHYHTRRRRGHGHVQRRPVARLRRHGHLGRQEAYVGSNYATWKVLANGPVRAVFELTYDAWDAGGVKVTETKRFTVDAGHNLDQIESTFT